MYDIIIMARTMFGTGFVLAHISAKGDVDTSRCMPLKDFVRHLRNALVPVGITREQASVYPAHSLRSGGATEAAVAKLRREDILHLAGVADANWLAYYNRMYLAERLRVSRSLGL